MGRLTDTRDDPPSSLHQWLQWQARQHGTDVALRHAHYGYVLESGRVVSEGSALQLAARGDLQDFYLGTKAGGVGRQGVAAGAVSG
ncbi:hypothetical protein [Pseudomonas citrulli]|uniref:Uncharacterized protein n=1 Tax=Pseudomonas citrulli TaxID=3064347 RepID=A0ABT9BTK2_9PSED|nr:hypothetical protein [Pseudomonas sp. K18]MDO7895895.1 hypothetical protein [Pseudomonas sp. K18]